jgi:CRP-like cAMP-binding protein
MPTKEALPNGRLEEKRPGPLAEPTQESVSAVYLTEVLSELNEGAAFLDQLTLNEIQSLRRIGSSQTFEADETIFLQGDQHRGIYLIESGRVRNYYDGPSGREITLAYWTQ